MKVNIIQTESDWVIGEISSGYARAMPNCTLHSPGFRGRAGDVNLYMTYAAFRGKTDGVDVGWFTHREHSHPDAFDCIASQVDFCIAMSNQTSKHLPSSKTVVLEPGIPENFIKPAVIFGCVGRNYSHTNRKKFSWIKELEQIKGSEFRFTNQQIPAAEMPAFYRAIDYLLVLSDNEGGPMPVPECIASGTPVIAPNVGWCWEYPVIRYSTFEELAGIIRNLCVPRYTVTQSAEKLFRLLTFFFNEKNKFDR